MSLHKEVSFESEICAYLAPESQRAIDLLQDRRTAPVSAAVNGQIDVPTLAAEPSHTVEESAAHYG